MKKYLQKNIDEYNRMYDEIFEDMDLVSAMKDSKSASEFKIKLLIIMESCLENLDDIDDNPLFLKFVKLKLHSCSEFGYIWSALNDEMRDRVDERIKRIKIKDHSPQTTDHRNQHTSLKPGMTKRQIAKLSELLSGRFIEPDSDLTKIFDTPLTSFEKPIKWITTIKLLAYLLEMMYVKNLINARDYASIVEKTGMFVNDEDKLIKSLSLRNAKSENVNISPPIGFEEIDRIIAAIKNT